MGHTDMPHLTPLSGGTHKVRLSRWRLAAFALPAVPMSALNLPIIVYLPAYYASNLGLGLSLVGTIFMVTRFWDVITDPILGLVSDKYKTRWGRRRHWLVLSVPFVLLPVVMVFMPSPPVTGGYLLFWMVVLYVGWTLLQVSHLSWGAELTSDYNERSTVQGSVGVAGLLGSILVLALPIVIEQMNPANVAAARVEVMGWYVVVLLPIAVAIAVWLVPERRVPDPRHVPWRETIRIILGNRPLRLVLACDLLIGVLMGILTALFLFFVNGVLELRSASLIIVVHVMSGALFIPVGVRISHRIGKHHALAAAAAFCAATIPLLLFIPPGSLVLALVIWTFQGFYLGMYQFLLRAIMADVADHDEVHSGNARTGLFFSMLTLTSKIGNAVAVGLSYAALDWIGFVPGIENSAEANDGLRAIYVWPVFALSVSVALIMWRFPLNRAVQVENRRILAVRAETEAAAYMGAE